MLYCQPAPDYLPAPEACLLTGITRSTACNTGWPSTNSPR
jgi:exodeoxyribonuclease-1